jgi:hypothetical protein
MKTLNDYIAEIKAQTPNPMVQDADNLRPMTEAEAENWYVSSAEINKFNDTLESQIKAKATEKASLLKKLGITQDEAQLLLG